MSDERKFLGVHVDKSADEYLSLWVVAHSTRKTKVIRTMLEEWEKKQTCTRDYLINEVVRQISIEWKRDKPEILKAIRGREDKLEVAFELFKTKSRSGLYRRGLSRKTVDDVIRRLEL